MVNKLAFSEDFKDILRSRHNLGQLARKMDKFIDEYLLASGVAEDDLGLFRGLTEDAGTEALTFICNGEGDGEGNIAELEEAYLDYMGRK